MQNQYDFIISVVQEAGKLLLAGMDESFEIYFKNGDKDDIVTDVDIKINNFLENKIRKTFPDCQIYSEEYGGDISSGSFWVIDPIDGTSNFSRFIPHFAIVISFIEDGEISCGAIFNPLTKELFSFEKDKGVFLNGSSVYVSRTDSLKEAWLILHVGHKMSGRDWGLNLYQTFFKSSIKMRNLGSSALDMAFLASGRVDAVIYTTMTTLDIAVSIAMVRSAGGEVYGLDGSPVKLSKTPQQIIATSTERLFEEVFKI